MQHALILSLTALLGSASLSAASSLPVIEGRISISGLGAPVTIARDRLGIPDIRGESFGDVIRGLGFVHGQDRFFQMDSTRRLAAGELSELVGAGALDMDRRYRRYRFRSISRDVLEVVGPEERDLIRAYTEGVNAGLDSLPAPPPEYGLLNATPEPWREEDSILVIYVLFDMLHMEAGIEKQLGVMRDALPRELFEFLTPIATRSDTLLIGGNPHNDYEPMPIPGPEVIDLRGRSASDSSSDLVEPIDVAMGSNNWAVAGSRSVHGGAILANDPHLQLTAPGIWYRAQLRWARSPQEASKLPNGQTSKSSKHEARQLGGLTLPGLPGITIGASDNIAWGFTNSMYDFQDLIIIEVHPDDPNLYRTPDGYEPFEVITETIRVRGRANETLALRKTRWGIVTDTDHTGRPLVLKWTALERPSADDTLDLGVFDIMHAQSLDDAVEAARNLFGPSQNILIASSNGRIAWVVSGYLPDRFCDDGTYDGRFPTSWADGKRGWRGPIPEEERPVIIDPEDGVLFTANNRTIDLERARRIGGIWTTGERAGRIAEMLREQDKFTEEDLFRMQLDTRVKVFDVYRDLAMEATKFELAKSEENARRFDDVLREARAILNEWDGTADADQPALRLLDVFRRTLHSRIIGALIAPCREMEPTFHYRWLMQEEPVQRILEERPAHLLPPGSTTWESFIATTWNEVIFHLSASRYENGLRTTWGEWNTSSIAHPIARIMPDGLPGAPGLDRMLNMPATPQPGHPLAVRVASPSFGASARMVVSPGSEHAGILQIPAGQSGHFQSPHYRDSHESWATGQPVPFLPGEPVAELILEPAAHK